MKDPWLIVFSKTFWKVPLLYKFLFTYWVRDSTLWLIPDFWKLCKVWARLGKLNIWLLCFFRNKTVAKIWKFERFYFQPRGIDNEIIRSYWISMCSLLSNTQLFRKQNRSKLQFLNKQKRTISWDVIVIFFAMGNFFVPQIENHFRFKKNKNYLIANFDPFCCLLNCVLLRREHM